MEAGRESRGEGARDGGRRGKGRGAEARGGCAGREGQSRGGGRRESGEKREEGHGFATGAPKVQGVCGPPLPKVQRESEGLQAAFSCTCGELGKLYFGGVVCPAWLGVRYLKRN